MNQNMTTEPTKLWNRQYILVLLLNTLNAFSFYMVVTILSKYLVSIGISIATAGVIVGLFSITSLCCRPFSGLLADRLSNVTLLKWSNILMGIGLLGFAFVTNPVLIVVFRIINGIGFAFSGTCQIALASKYIPKNKMGEGIGYLGLGMVIGSAVAPGIGVTISENFGMRMTFLMSAVLTVAALVILCLFHEEKKENKERGIFILYALPDTKKLNLTEAQAYDMIWSTFHKIQKEAFSAIVFYGQETGTKSGKSFDELGVLLPIHQFENNTKSQKQCMLLIIL